MTLTIKINFNDWSNCQDETRLRTPTEPTFSLLPNGRRKKSFLTRVKNLVFRKGTYRRAAYAVDSKATFIGDGLSELSMKLKAFMKNRMERLRQSEPSWADFEDLFSGANYSFIPMISMHPATVW